MVSKESLFVGFPDPSIEKDFIAISPLDYYLSLINQESGFFPSNEIYCSSPVTSANYGLLISNGTLDKALKPKVFKLNARLNERIVSGIDPYLLGKDSAFTLPHTFPQITGWGEYDYLLFWLMYFSRLSEDSASRFSSQIRQDRSIDIKMFNDYSQDRRLRWNEYLKLIPHYQSAVNQDEKPENRITAMVAFPGHNKSLGCSVELLAASSIGIPIYEVGLNTLSDQYTTDMTLPGYGWEVLYKYHQIRPEIPLFESNSNSLLVLDFLDTTQIEFQP